MNEITELKLKELGIAQYDDLAGVQERMLLMCMQSVCDNDD